MHAAQHPSLLAIPSSFTGCEPGMVAWDVYLLRGIPINQSIINYSRLIKKRLLISIDINHNSLIE